MTLRRNTPTPEGTKLGTELARLTEGAIAEARAVKGAYVPERCKSCAFRAGTFPNGCAETVIDALNCVVAGTTFYCHVGYTEDPDDLGKRVCAGWWAAVAKSAQIPDAIKQRVVAVHELLERARKEAS